ncbi:MAG: LEPR-XLL domain-containing protein, partial [Chlorobium sp.]|nr:LEPR-XLL domain-containing protein [Chlorobium sp.]
MATKKKRSSKNLWRLEKLEQRILLSATLPTTSQQEHQDATATAEVSTTEIIQTSDQEITAVTDLATYQPVLSEPLVNLADAILVDENVDVDPTATPDETIDPLRQSDTTSASDESAAPITATSMLPASNSDDIHLTPDTILTATEPLVIDGQEILSGSGTIVGSVVNEHLVSPGNSPGLQNITGNFTQDATGTTLIELAGTTAGSGFDQINISGTATLAGTLDIDLYGGFTPTVGQSFQIFTWSGYTGTFDQYSGLDLYNGTRLNPVYSSTGLKLEVVSNADITLSASLQGQLSSLAQQLITHQDSLLSSYDAAAGSIIAGSVLAEVLPGTDVSLESLLGYQDIFELGSFIQYYLHTAPEGATDHPLGDYTATAGLPTMQGLVAYLNSNWIPTLGSTAVGDLRFVNTATGSSLSFQNTFTTTKSLAIDPGDLVKDFGLNLEEQLTADVTVQSSVNFGFSLNQAKTTFSFALGAMDFSATAAVNNLVTAATFGPLAVSLGSASGDKGSLSIDLAGRISLDGTGKFTCTTIRDTITLDLPVYAQLAGVNLSAVSGLPRLLLTGNPLTSDTGFTFTTENFDALTRFPTLSVADLILMFPSFVDALDSIRASSDLVVSIPFAEATLQGVSDFGHAFQSAILDKIDFNRPRVDLLTGTASLTAGTKTLVLTGANLTADMVGKYFTFEGVGTVQITAVDLATKTLTLAGSFSTAIANGTWVIHEAIEQIQTLQEFVAAVNASGILPLDVQISYDPITQQFVVPITFTKTSNQTTDLSLDLAAVDGLALETSATGTLAATVSGALDIFFDLNGAAVSGIDGLAGSGSTTFTSTSGAFTSAMTGWTLEVDGESYVVQSVTDAHTLVLQQAVAGALTDAVWELSEGLVIGIDNVNLGADISLDASDMEVAMVLGFLGATIGGSGSESTLHAGVSSGVTMDRGGANGKRFSLDELADGTFLEYLDFDLDGSASATLKGLSLNPGFGDDLVLPGSPEIAIYVQDAFAPSSSVVRVDHDPLGDAFDLAEFISDGGATGNDVVLVLPDLGDAFNFQNISFAQIIEGVQLGIDFLQDSLAQEDFYTAVLPILNFSLADTLTFLDDFTADLLEAQNNPAGTIQEVEQIFEDALGLLDNNSLAANEQMFALSFADDVLRIHINFEQVFSQLVTFNLDMRDLERLGGGNMPALADIPLLSDALGAGAAANILLEALFEVQVDAGIDISDLDNPELFLFDYDTATSEGTFATLGFRVAGSELGMGFNIGPLSLGVAGGTAVIDGDGNIATTDFASLTIALNQMVSPEKITVEMLKAALLPVISALHDTVQDEIADTIHDNLGWFMQMFWSQDDIKAKLVGAEADGGLGLALDNTVATGLAQLLQSLLPPDDGRYHFDEKIAYNIDPLITGGMSIDLPLVMDFQGLSFDIPDISIDLNPNIDFGDLLAGLNLPDIGSLLDIELPDFPDIFQNIGFSFSLDLVLQNFWVILDGLDFSLGSIEDLFFDLLDIDLPFIGDLLPDFLGFLPDLRLDLLGDLRLDLAMNGDVIAVMRDAYYDVFGPDGLGILQDSADDGAEISINDVLVNWYKKDGSLMQVWSGGNTLAGADAVQFDMLLGGTVLGTGIDIPLDIDLPGFAFNIDGGLGLAIDWSFDFGMGISGSDGFYLVTNADDDDAEFEVNIDVYLDGDTDTRVVDTFAADGTLAFLTAHLTDNGTIHGASGLFGAFTLDIVGDSRQRLTMLNMAAKPAAQNFVADFQVDGEFNLGMVLEVEGASVLPKLVGNLLIDWDYSVADGLSTPSITFDNLGIDVGSLVDDFLLPIIENIEGILSPVKPIVDALYQDVGMGVIGIDNVMDLIDTLMQLQGKPTIDWAFVLAAKQMFDMSDTVRAWSDMGGVILLGDIANLGTLDVGAVSVPDVSLPSDFSLKMEQLEEEAQGSAGVTSTQRSGFKVLEYLTDITTWMNLLTGKDATLFTYEMPLMAVGASFSVPLFGLALGPVNFGIMAKGSVSLAADFAFGYDTYGIRKAIETSDPVYAFDGFYVSDVTLPTFSNGSIVAGTGGEEKPELMFDLDVGIEAGISAAIISAGLRGGITFYADLDLQDIASSSLTKDDNGYITDVDMESDGKIRMSEIITMYEYEGGGFANLFNISGGAGVYAKAYVDLDLPIIGSETIIDITLFEATLFSFAYNAPYVEPTLGRVEGGVLYLNAGGDAGDRAYFNTSDGDEQFFLYGSNGTVDVEFDGWYQTFNGVSSVEVDMGAGNDLLDASRLSGVTVNAHGGSGDDNLILGSNGGTLHGDAGDDELSITSASNAVARLYGDGGDDQLTGAGGADILDGGTGTDRLSAGSGNDTLTGGTGDDTLAGGAGVDTYVFASGFGLDRFTDLEGDTSLDFSAFSTAMVFGVSRSGVSAASILGDEVRTGAARVTQVKLGSGADQVAVKSFADYAVTLTDSGGNDDYRIQLDKPDVALPTGTLNIVDNGGSFDELAVTQNFAATAVNVNLGQVTNGREIINFNGGIDRLTLTGGAAAYDAEAIRLFGGTVKFSTTNGSGQAGPGNIGFRVIGQSISYDKPVKARNVILDSFDTLTISHQLTAINNGYIDLRTYDDAADLTLNADLRVSAGDTTNGDGSGWLRLTSSNGSILNTNGSMILATGSTLQLRAYNAIGTTLAPILTTVANLTAITSTTGSGDIVITETDDLSIQTQASLTDVENSGFVVTPTNGDNWWENETTWDTTANANWLDVLQSLRSGFMGRTDYGVEAGHDNVALTLLAENGLLTLASGEINALATGADITLTTDDLDFVSGEGKVIASGDLLIQAHQLDWDYLLGGAAEVTASDNEIGRAFHQGSMTMGMRDFAALANGFATVTVGRRNAGNTMTIGDLFDIATIKMTGPDPSLTTDDLARTRNNGAGDHAELKDHTIFLSDDLQVKGDVRASDNTIDLRAQTISINAKNSVNLLGLPDSGLAAETLTIVADDQLHVGGWLVADSLVDIDVTATTGVNPTGTGMYVTPPNGVTSLLTDLTSRIESLNAGSQVLIEVSEGAQVFGRIEAHGAGSQIKIALDGDFLLNEGANLVAEDAGSLVEVSAGGLMAINSGSAISAGIRYDQVNGAPVPVLTGAGADIALTATGEMLIGGAVGTADGLSITSGSATRDDELYGDPDEDSYLSQYVIYNKTAYFDLLAIASPDHYLVGHTGQYGLMVSGTIVSLGDNTALSLSSADDLIIRGNISATGSGSTIAIASDAWSYVEGNILANAGISISGDSYDAHDASVYVHATSTIRTTAANADITVTGSHDVDLFGVLVAGGIIGQNGVTWTGAGADLSVSAGSQLLVETGLLAAGNVSIHAGTANAGDDSLSLLISTAGGATARGYNGTGGNLSISADGNMEMMGTLLSGGSLVQTFDGDGNLLTQNVDWSGTLGTTTITTDGQAFIGGHTVNSDNQPTVTGGYIYSAANITITGGSSTDGNGVFIQGASEVVVHKADGHIQVNATQDAEIAGLLVAGGEVVQIRDASGAYQGRQVNTFGGASTLTIEAEDQIRVGVGLQAGASIDLIGGDDPSGTGLILYGSAMLSTWMENSTINLNAPGRVDVLAPAHTNEVLSQGWPIDAAGKLSEDLSLAIAIDKVSHTISATVSLTVADTADNTSVNDLLTDLQAALVGGTWTVSNANLASPLANGDIYTHFADDQSTVGQIDPDLQMKLREGRLNFTGPYSFSIKQTGSSHADQLGLNLSSGDLDSGLYYAIDAREAGSVVNIGAPDGPNGKVYVAGKVIADTAINLFSGTEVGEEVELDVTGVLETVHGSISFDAGRDGVVKGSIVAGGTDSDISLASEGSLTIQGRLDAYHDVILSGGSVEQADALSLKIDNTARILSSGGGGTITLGGANEVVIDGVVGTGSTSLASLNITSTYGTVTVTQASGWVTADAPLTIRGKDIDIDGVVESIAADGTAQEVLFAAVDTLTVHGDVTSIGDLRLHAGSLVAIYDATVAVTGAGALLEVFSDGDISSSSVGIADGHAVLADGEMYQLGATIQGTGLVHFQADGDLTIGSAVLVGSNAAGSSILLEADTATVIGSVLAGANVTSGSAVWTVNNATLSLDLTNQLVMGGNAFTINGTTTSWQPQGGNLKSTGDLTLTVSGGSNAVSISQNSLSSISADSTGGGSLSTAATPSDLTVDANHSVNLYGSIQANQAGAVIDIDSGATLLIDGIVEAGAQLSLDANALIVNTLIYQRGGTGNLYFVDDTGRLMDGQGNLVDADGHYVDEDGDSVATPVAGGNPIRLSGGILNTLAGGSIDITATGAVNLNGQVGKPIITNQVVSVNVSDITVTTSGDIGVSGLVNANTAITLVGDDISVFAGGVVKTRGAAGEVRLDASGNVYVASDTLLIDGKNEAEVTAAALLHVSGVNLQLDGSINAHGDSSSRLLTNAATSLTVTGVLTSTGIADIRGGVNLSQSDAQLEATTVDAANLGAALITISNQGGILVDGDINLTNGGDLSISSTAELQDGQLALLTPVISTEVLTIQVVTGYSQVADGFILVPKVTWVTTTVTEQTGTEEVKAGIRYNTMDITLTQTGYYNGSTWREFFVEGVDYSNSAVNWALTGASNPGAGVQFGTLNALQRSAVLQHLGYKEAYTFSYTNPLLHQVINGNPTQQAWTPDWAGNANTWQNIQVSGWEDKYISLPTGAAADVLRVVSQGSPVLSSENVGQYQDLASVRYTQQNTDYGTQTQYFYEPWYSTSTRTGFSNPGSTYVADTRTVSLASVYNEYFKVSYNTGTGSRVYNITDGHSGSFAYTPGWSADSTSTNYNPGGYNPSGRYLTAPTSYYNATLTTTQNGGAVSSWSVNTGYITASSYSYTQRNFWPITVGDTDDYNDSAVGNQWIDYYNTYHSSSAHLATFASYSELSYAVDKTTLDGWYFVGLINSNAGYATVSSPNGVSLGGTADTWYWLGDGGTASGKTYFSKSDSMWNTNEPSGDGGEGTVLVGGTGDKQLNDLNGATNTSWGIIESEPVISGGSTQNDTYSSYNYDWASTWTTVYDSRKTLQYQFTTNATDVFETRPVYNTYDVQSKVVTNQQYTVWRNEPITADQNVTRTIRGFDASNVGYGAFEDEALRAGGDISITTGDDVSVSGLITGAGAGSDISIQALGDITINGLVPTGALAGTLAATSMLVTPGVISLDAGGALSVGNAGSLQSTGASGSIGLTAGDDLVAEGNLTASGGVSLQANDTVTLGSTITSAADIAIIAGQDGSGSINGTVEASLSTSTAGDRIDLTAGAASGSITLTNSAIGSTSGSVSLTANSGAVQHSGGLIQATSLSGASRDGFAAITEISSLEVENSGSGGISVDNEGALTITTLATGSGAITLRNFGAVQATTLRTEGTADSDDITLTTYGGGLTYTTLTTRSGGLGDVTLNVQGALTGAGASTLLRADTLAVEGWNGVQITTDINSLTMHVAKAGDVTITDQGSSGLTVTDLTIAEGDLVLTSAGNLALKNINLMSERSDATLSSGGAITGLANGGSANLLADTLTLSATSGIASLLTQTNELTSVVTTSGGIGITNLESTADDVPDLLLRQVRADGGDIAIRSNGNMSVYEVRALGTSATLALTSSTGNIVVRDPVTVGGLGVHAANIVLDAATKLDLEVQVDATDSLIFRTGERFALATTATYSAQRITIESDDAVLMTGNLVMGGGSISITSARNIELDGTISKSGGGVLGSLELTTTGDNPLVVYDTDPLFGFAIYHTSGGVEYLEKGGHYYQTSKDGRYAQSALYIPVTGAASSTTVFSVNADGTGDLYNSSGDLLDASRYTILGRGYYEVADPGGLIRQFRLVENSAIVVDLGSQVFGAMAISAGGTRGAITLNAAQNLDLTGHTLQATGDISLSTTGSLTVAEGSIGGISTNLPEFITLSAGGNLILNSNLAVEDGTRLLLATPYNVEGTVTLTSGGTITMPDASRRITGTNIVANAVTGIELRSNADHISASLSGSGAITIADAGAVTVDQAIVGGHGSIALAAQGTLTLSEIRIATDTTGNGISASSATGDIQIDLLNAGRNNGVVFLTAGGKILEKQPDDVAVDITALSLTAIPGKDSYTSAFDLETNVGTSQIGRPTDLSLNYVGDLSLTGAYVGYINLNVTGTLTLDALSAGTYITATATGGIVIRGSVQASTSTLSLSASNGNSLTMDDGSTLTSTGAMTLGAGGNILLARLSSANTAAVTSSSGFIHDNTVDENANITAAGLITLNASTGIGVSGDPGDLDIQGTVTASTAVGGIYLTDSDAMTVNATTVTAGDLVLTSGGAMTVAGTLSVVSGTLSLGAGGLYTQNADVTVSGAAALSSVGGTLATTADLSAASLNLNTGSSGLSMGDGSTLSSTSGAINVTAGSNIVLSHLSSAGTATVTATGGFIHDNTADENANIMASGLITLSAATGIGVSGAAGDLDVQGMVTASTSTGGIYLTDSDVMTVNTVTATAGDLVLTSGGAMTVDGDLNVASGTLSLNAGGLYTQNA